MVLGRPPKDESGLIKTYLLSCTGKQEVALYDRARQMARKMDIPIKLVILAGIQRYVEGEQSISKLLGDYIQIKNEKIKIVKVKKKQKQLSIKEHIESQSWFDSK